MPEQEANTATTAPADLGAHDERDHGKSSLISRLSIVFFLAGIVGVECLLAYLYIPTRSQTAASADVIGETENGDSAGLLDGEEDLGSEDEVEVDLGEFRVTAYQPSTNTTVRIDFQLYGTLHPDNQVKFDEIWAESTHRFRDQVITTIRSSEPEELSDPGLGLIKRRILEKTNKTLGKPLLESVIFTKFSHSEQ